MKKILLFPLKLIFLIIAYLLKGILYILAYILTFIADFCGVIHLIVGFFTTIFAICGTIVVMGWIQQGSFQLLEGCVVIGILWLFAMGFNILFNLGDSIADFLENIGDNLSDFALDFFCL